MRKTSFIVLTTSLLSFSVFAGDFTCDKAAAEQAMQDLRLNDNFQGDMVLFKQARLNTIAAYTKLLEAEVEKSTVKKIQLMGEAMDLCNNEAP